MFSWHFLSTLWCPTEALLQGHTHRPKHFSHSSLAADPRQGPHEGAACTLAAWCSPIIRRLLKFGVCWLVSLLRKYHAIEEIFLEICVPIGSN